MKQKLLLLTAVLLCILQNYAQTGAIYNNGARILSLPGNYWVVKNGNFTLTSESTVNLATIANLIIENNSSLALTPTTCLTVTGTLTNNKSAGTNGLIINSNATGTSSLIASASSGAGSASAERWIAAGKWNIISSPLSGQLVSDFLTNNLGIATKNVSGTDVRGIIDYNPQSNMWSIPSASGPAGYLGGGKGFSMRLQGINPPADNAAVIFKGALQTGDQSMSGLIKDKWNCIGNPYTSAMGVTANSSVGAASFLSVNVTDEINSNINPSYGYIYVWSDGDASNGKSGCYKMIGNLGIDFSDTDIQQGQAFMVKMNTNATTLLFNQAMQLHAPVVTLKSAKAPWPSITLKAKVGIQESSTLIAFNNGMTKGLDPTYDAGIFKGEDIALYSRLLEDNGVDFAIQCLPLTGIENVIIPIGFDSKAGGEVVFTAKSLNLPVGLTAILEDRFLNSKTLLDSPSDQHKTTVQANSTGTGRFYLRLKSGTTRIDPTWAGKNINAWIERDEIVISGVETSSATAMLYDVAGRAVMVNNLQPSPTNRINASHLKPGIYILKVMQSGRNYGFKIHID